MKKLKNLHPLREIVVHGQVIILGFMLTISRIGGTNPISFVSASIPLPRPAIVKRGKYHGKTGKNFSQKSGKEVSALAFARLGSLEPGTPN